MKLETVLSNLNSLEKNSFLKIIDNIISRKPKNTEKIERLLSEGSKDLKNIDNINISKIFSLVEDEFSEYIKEEFGDTESQLDILTDLLVKDGRCIARLDWFSRLYELEIKNFEKKRNQFVKEINSGSSEIESVRLRDYMIYMSCLRTAYFNDELNNQENKITRDEQSILHTLIGKLELSQEETKLINYSILPIVKKDIEKVINDLKNVGIIFYSKKNNTIYIPQEIVRVLRKIRKKEIADKYFKRVLLQIREPMINIACRKHNIDWRMSLKDKIEAIVSQGISFSGLLITDIHKEGTNLNDRKKYFTELCEKDLKIETQIKGSTIEEKVENLIKYYDESELEERVSISFDGFEKLLLELNEVLPDVNELIRNTFELQDKNVMNSTFLLDFNLKPQDILEIIPENELQVFIEIKGIKSRGNKIINILDHYKDAENLYIENYENIAYRNYNELKENGIHISEANLGVKFEELTKSIFIKLGFNVDETLRKKINT